MEIYNIEDFECDICCLNVKAISIYNGNSLPLDCNIKLYVNYFITVTDVSEIMYNKALNIIIEALNKEFGGTFKRIKGDVFFNGNKTVIISYFICEVELLTDIEKVVLQGIVG